MHACVLTHVESYGGSFSLNDRGKHTEWFSILMYAKKQ